MARYKTVGKAWVISRRGKARGIPRCISIDIEGKRYILWQRRFRAHTTYPDYNVFDPDIKEEVDNKKPDDDMPLDEDDGVQF